MSFDAVMRRPVHQQVASQLREAILDGELRAGAALPPERELCVQFGVGRTSVREALRALEAQGLLIAAGPTAPFRVTGPTALSAGPVRESLVALLRLGHVPLRDLIELRQAVEGAAAAAAARAEAAELQDAEEAAEQMAGATDIGAFERADVRFHAALVGASGNAAMHLVMLAVRGAIAEHLRETLRSLEDPTAELARLADEHRAILDAVRRGAAEDAERLMRAHVAELYGRVEVVR